MKKNLPLRNLVLVLVLSLGFSAGCQSQTEQNKDTQTTTADGKSEVQPAAVQNIDVTAFAEMIANTKGLQILDVRTPEEVAVGIVEGAVHINVFDGDFSDRAVKQLDKNAPLAIYCKMGGRSSRAANTLLAAGFKQVYNITGGITAWNAAAKPTVMIQK